MRVLLLETNWIVFETVRQTEGNAMIEATGRGAVALDKIYQPDHKQMNKPQRNL